MPVTPVQAFRLTDEEFEVLRLVENKVDAFLSENYFPGLSVQVNLPKKNRDRTDSNHNHDKIPPIRLENQ